MIRFAKSVLTKDLYVVQKEEFSINHDQFSVLCANTCRFYRFTFKILKLLNSLKVLKITTCFGQYGHPQVLKSKGGNCCYSASIVCVPSMRTYVCNRREKFFVRIFVREVSLCRVVTCLCTHCAWCIVLLVVLSCLFYFLILAGLV
jgi:hypothetical protein